MGDSRFCCVCRCFMLLVPLYMRFAYDDMIALRCMALRIWSLGNDWPMSRKSNEAHGLSV